LLVPNPEKVNRAVLASVGWILTEVIVLFGNPLVLFVHVAPPSVERKTWLEDVAYIIDALDLLIANSRTALEPLTFEEIELHDPPSFIER
jgi:hypothetical protein